MKFAKFSSRKYFSLIGKIALGFIGSKIYAQVLEILFSCYQRKGTVYTMGCGGSASTATHFAADLAKTTRVNGKPGFKALSLVDNIPLVSAWVNDKGWHSIFAGQLEQWLTKDDVLIGFSVHGGTKQGDEAGPWSQNLVAAMQLAQKRGAKIIGFAGFDGGAMREMADAAIVIPISSEPYATPAIEALHVVLHHAIIYDLKERIKGRHDKKTTA